MLSLDKSDSSNSEKNWKINGFFGDQKSDFTTPKLNFPENTLVYCNQGTISTLKAGECAIYLDHVILGQVIAANNSPPNLDNNVLEENEVILHVPLYNTKTGYFRGVKNWLAFIMIQGDPDEVFYSYGYNDERSKVLYSSFKQPLPNIFQGAAFKKHVPQLIEEKQTQDQSKLFFFLSSTTDMKEKINKFFGKAYLYPIDCPYDDFVNYSTKNRSFLPHQLDSRNTTERKAAREIVRNFLKHV